jgi:hypothetical protein
MFVMISVMYICIDEHATRSPTAQHEARFFGPAQARHGPFGFVPVPARPGRPGHAWAVGYARRAAWPGPPGKAGTEPARFQARGHNRPPLPHRPFIPQSPRSATSALRSSARRSLGPSPFSVNTEPAPLSLPDLHRRPARSPLWLSPVFVTPVTHRLSPLHSPICNPNPLSLTSPVTHRLSTAGSPSPATSARLFCAAHPLRLSLPNPLARRRRRRSSACRASSSPRPSSPAPGSGLAGMSLSGSPSPIRQTLTLTLTLISVACLVGRWPTTPWSCWCHQGR